MHSKYISSKIRRGTRDLRYTASATRKYRWILSVAGTPQWLAMPVVDAEYFVRSIAKEHVISRNDAHLREETENVEHDAEFIAEEASTPR